MGAYQKVTETELQNLRCKLLQIENKAKISEEKMKFNVIMRIISDSARYAAMAFRQARKYAKDTAAKESDVTKRLKNIIKGMLNTEFRLLNDSYKILKKNSEFSKSR